MMTFPARATITTATILLLAAAEASFAGLAPGPRCEVGKLKTVASYASCRLKADASAITKSESPSYTKCEEKINAKFPKLDEAAEGACAVDGDLSDIRGRTDTFATQIAILLSGGTLPATECGDGTIDLGEECDVGDLDGETCATQGFGGGTLHCGPGCTFETSECYVSRFEDTGNTILDHDTGLEWEKKDASDGVIDLANRHDVDNGYTHASGGSNTTQSGTLYSDFLYNLNGVVDNTTKTTSGCFEGHCDWRIPTIDELKSIALFVGCGGAPCVVDALFLPNRSGGYWSNSTVASLTTGGYYVQFSSVPPSATSNLKTATFFARAVRTAE